MQNKQSLCMGTYLALLQFTSSFQSFGCEEQLPECLASLIFATRDFHLVL